MHRYIDSQRKRERKRGDLKHLSVHKWLRSAIPDSQPPTSPIGFLFFETSATALCGTTGIHLKDMHVEATPHLHDILVVHLFNAGLPCMASG